MEIELGPLSERETYAILTQTILPRPIAWALTDNSLSADAQWNIAPFSFFNGISSEPPMVMFSIGSWDVPGRVKDTLMNLRKKPNFTIGISNQSLIKQVQQSAMELDHGVSEVSQFSILTKSWDWPTPLIADCKINFACTIAKEVKIDESSQILVFARITKIWVADEAVSRDEKDRIVIDPVIVDPLLRLGAGKYGNLGSVLPTPKTDS
ncbi:MAG: flavin reductase family protein [Candidatus Planktophila sp.]